MKFSVILCSRERSAHVVQTLTTLLAALETPAQEWEFVVVDNASTDDTAAAAKRVLGDRGTVVLEERLGLS